MITINDSMQNGLEIITIISSYKSESSVVYLQFLISRQGIYNFFSSCIKLNDNEEYNLISLFPTFLLYFLCIYLFYFFSVALNFHTSIYK